MVNTAPVVPAHAAGLALLVLLMATFAVAFVEEAVVYLARVAHQEHPVSLLLMVASELFVRSDY